MAYSIFITPAALNDLEDAINYYNSKAANLGSRFANEADKQFETIAKNPDAFAERYKNVRGKLLAFSIPYFIYNRP